MSMSFVYETKLKCFVLLNCQGELGSPGSPGLSGVDGMRGPKGMLWKYSSHPPSS